MLCYGGACDSKFVFGLRQPTGTKGSTPLAENAPKSGEKKEKAWTALPYSKHTVMEILKAPYINRL